jgi:hypothetical protein
LPIEYDGSLHLVGEQRARDVRREEAFRRVGLEVVTVVSEDLAHRARLVRRILDARQRARWQAETRRAWTTDLPSWWVPTRTVEQRRALTDWQRERWLRHRRPAG